ncbi:MAG: hypothetical protein V4676_01105 [Bacteroidota bacterium]
MLLAWTLVLAGMTTLLVAANKKNKVQLCKGLSISIKGTGKTFYIEEAAIKKQLESVQGKITGKRISSINLSLLEKKLEAGQWIRDAELYFDSENELHVFVEEREPIARVFTTSGASFYIDSSGHQMPLLHKLTARLPVITGYVNSRRDAKDSAFINEVKSIAWYVYSHPFWTAQVGQIDITTNRKFEIIPVIGDNVIRIGDGNNLEEKFKNLFLFYQKVLSKTGFNKYAVIDAQYAHQIVVVHKGPASAVDSIQLQKNIEELMFNSSIENISEEMLPTLNAKDSIQASTNMSDTVNTVPVKTNPTPTAKKTATAKKPAAASNPPMKNQTKKPSEKPKPKAVMQKRV